MVQMDMTFERVKATAGKHEVGSNKKGGCYDGHVHVAHKKKEGAVTVKKQMSYRQWRMLRLSIAVRRCLP